MSRLHLLASITLCGLVSGCTDSQQRIEYRDLNKNGQLDVYEDSGASTDARVADLLSKMSIAEKAGLMFIYRTMVNDDGSLEYDAAFGPERMHAIANISDRQLNHFNVGDIPDDLTVFAKWQNALQRYAETKTRLGIPITIASDPRHHFSTNIYAFASNGFSQFPETLGLAAINDISLIGRFADIVREEYLAVGIRLALHPQVDLATEPRWPRINGGFGEDARLSADIAAAYVRGLQGPTLSNSSVATMTKHFPGGGPQNEGLDPHFEFQKGQIYPGSNFDYHLAPFEAAIQAGTAAIMPYYGVPTDQTSEEVAMAFNKDIITGLLREKYEYDGVVCADWGVLTDITIGNNIPWAARAWGVEHLSRTERVAKALEAGMDQFGGESASHLVVELHSRGELSEERIDESARRILRQKFDLGLFDDPYVDAGTIHLLMGKPEAKKLGHESQRRSLTLLTNTTSESGPTLPLKSDRMNVFIENLDAEVVAPYATVVASPEEADFAILRLDTPWVAVETDNPFAQGFHHGDLDFKGERKKEILDLLDTVPTIVVIYLDRPAVIPDIVSTAAAVVADYGASDQAVVEVLFGEVAPEGRLPFELPSSMQAVRDQLADVPADSANPLFESGFGLSYR